MLELEETHYEDNCTEGANHKDAGWDEYAERIIVVCILSRNSVEKNRENRKRNSECDAG